MYRQTTRNGARYHIKRRVLVHFEVFYSISISTMLSFAVILAYLSGKYHLIFFLFFISFFYYFLSIGGCQKLVTIACRISFLLMISPLHTKTSRKTFHFFHILSLVFLHNEIHMPHSTSGQRHCAHPPQEK